jgi:hypothetical protein
VTTRKPTSTRKATTTKKATTTAKVPTCSITDGFTNGEFLSGDGWTFEQPHIATLPGSRFGAVGTQNDRQSNDGRDLLVDFYLGDSLVIDYDIAKDTTVSASFETDVRVCPGVEYDLRFGWRNARTKSMKDCRLTLFVGDGEVFATRDWEHENWRHNGEIAVPSFRVGQSGVRQTGSELYVKFRGILTCQPEPDHLPASSFILKKFWTTFVLDSFSLTPRVR